MPLKCCVVQTQSYSQHVAPAENARGGRERETGREGGRERESTFVVLRHCWGCEAPPLQIFGTCSIATGLDDRQNIYIYLCVCFGYFFGSSLFAERGVLLHWCRACGISE